MKIRFADFPALGDDRGHLVAVEGGNHIPFEIKRVYFVYDTKKGVIRGNHAHKKLQQVVFCVTGSCHFLLDDGINKKEVLLDNPNKGLFLDPMIWHEMYDFSESAVLVVFASEHYDEQDYIRNYDDFLKVVNT